MPKALSLSGQLAAAPIFTEVIEVLERSLSQGSL